MTKPTVTIKAAVAVSKPFVVAREYSSSLPRLVASETGHSTPAVHSGMDTLVVPRGYPVGTKSVAADMTSVAALAVEEQTLVGRCSVAASGPGKEHAFG